MTTGEVVVKHLPGIRQILVLYPYEVTAGWTVAAKSPEGYNARFGFIFTQTPAVCDKGYDPKEWRAPRAPPDQPEVKEAPSPDPASKTNARGAQNAPRTAAAYRTGTGSPVATYDLGTGQMTWNDQASASPAASGSDAAQLYGEDSWSSLLLPPVM